MGVFGWILRRKEWEMRKFNDNYFSFLNEFFTGIREVKLLHIEDVTKGRFVNLAKKIFDLRLNIDVTRALSNLSTLWLYNISSLVVMGVGGYLIISGSLTMGVYVAFNNYAGQFNSSLGRIAELNVSIQETLVALERIFTLIDNFTLPTERIDGVIPERISGKVQIKDIAFGYEPEIPILHDISCTIQPNQITAIVGISGSGKTTLLNLLLRLYQPSMGEILLDDYPISALHLDYLRQEIAVVSQEPYLFNMSIRDNLRLARMDATDENIKAAADQAYIHHFIMGLPEGYETVIGERGLGLSGGQKQRLAIARAILKGAKIILFDEATSALDSEAEEHIHEILRDLAKNHTIIVVAHRLQTVINAQQIIVLADGEIVGVGNHQSLIQSNHEYQRLYLSQADAMQQVLA